ncbi:MAG: hypothetical protein M1823_001174 [Watsoniomyces obsoletus]|nr:MAG: hypothetical protein M1823_001174 [Watsoniomyces obsoletus]
MPGPATTLLIEGSFEELAEELAQYLDHVRKPGGATSSTPTTGGEEGSTTIHGEVTRLLEGNQKDDVLKKLVTAKFIQTYNLLIHLIRQSPNVNIFLPRICQSLSNPITTSPVNGPAMALTALTTIFNILQSDNDVRFHVFLAIISVVKSHGLYEVLKPQLKNLDRWIIEWDSDEEEQQKMFLEIAMAADDAGEAEESYHYLLRALRTIPPSESSSPQARKLSLRALRTALLHPSHFDFSDLTPLDAMRGLQRTDPIWFELLEIFNGKNLDDYEDFREEHDSEESEDSSSDDTSSSDKEHSGSWLEKNGLDDGILTRKIRLLTLTSLAASSGSRSLPYASIARALSVPQDDVEMWVIDVIRAGLVEGKLSQSNQTFLIHRATHRLFGEKQWREVASRLDVWRGSLTNVLRVLREERESSRKEMMINGGGGGRGGLGMGGLDGSEGRMMNGGGGNRRGGGGEGRGGGAGRDMGMDGTTGFE